MKRTLFYTLNIITLVFLNSYVMGAQTVVTTINNQENLVTTSEHKSTPNGNNLYSAGVAPSQIFDLSQWSLSVPSDNDKNWIADNIQEKELNAG